MVTHGSQLGAVFGVGVEAMVIGRSETAGVKIDGEGVSREHARISRDSGGAVLLRDLGSANGTLVNGRAADNFVLRTGDRIQIGRACEFEFRYEVADERDTVDLEDSSAARSAVENTSTAGRTLARMHMERGEWDAALAALRRARAQLEARPQTDRAELAAVFSDLAECELETGDEAASATAQLAIDLVTAGGGTDAMRAAALFISGRALAVRDEVGGRALVVEARGLLPLAGPLAQRMDAWLSAAE